MSQDRFINIITGELQPFYQLNSKSNRFSGTQFMRSKRMTNLNTIGNQSQLPKIKRLGNSKDSKAFSYGYNYKSILKDQIQKQTHKTLQPYHYSSINTSKSQFNIVNHFQQNVDQPKQWNTRKFNHNSDLSKFTDLGRLNAPNYSLQYEQKLNKNPQVNRFRKNLCNNICQIQKSYGKRKYFRKFK